MATWRNNDGLVVRFGTTTATPSTVGVVSDNDDVVTVVALIDTASDNFPSATGTDTIYDPARGVAIPQGSLVRACTLVTLEAFDSSGDNGTLTIGLLKEDGTALDVDGIDVTIAQSAIDTVGETVACDGDLVNGVALTADGYLSLNNGTSLFTAGKALLTITYIVPR